MKSLGEISTLFFKFYSEVTCFLQEKSNQHRTAYVVRNTNVENIGEADFFLNNNTSNLLETA
jgi:hypothetical protein